MQRLATATIVTIALAVTAAPSGATGHNAFRDYRAAAADQYGASSGSTPPAPATAPGETPTPISGSGTGGAHKPAHGTTKPGTGGSSPTGAPTVAGANDTTVPPIVLPSAPVQLPAHSGLPFTGLDLLTIVLTGFGLLGLGLLGLAVLRLSRRRTLPARP
jgi:hypothetical protein